MLTLHGTWMPVSSESSGRFLLWSEESVPESLPKRRGRRPASPPHPYALPADQLTAELTRYAEHLGIDWSQPSEGEGVLTLPSLLPLPFPSRPYLIDIEGEISLRTWKVPLVGVHAEDAFELLAAMPLTAYGLPWYVGEDLRFWTLAAKFGRRLIAEQKYLPFLSRQSSQLLASWQPDLAGSEESQTFAQLAQTMPDACRAVESVVTSLLADGAPPARPKQQKIPTPHSEQLLADFLQVTLDRWIRQHVDKRDRGVLLRGVKDTALRRWFEALIAPQTLVKTEGAEGELAKLVTDFQAWVQEDRRAEEKFRVCFRLEPPERKDAPWQLRYFLQAVDDPSLLVPVEVVWNESRATLHYLNRQWESPHERLLAGLGIASRMFPPMERSLHQASPEACALSYEEAYQFLSETSLLLQQSGFGVLAPPGWTDRRPRLRARVSVQSPPQESSGIFSLDQIAAYDIELALEGETISPEELERLAQLKAPLVQMRGEWVLLRPEDIEKALNTIEKYRDGGEMMLQDVLQLALSDSPELDSLPVESVKCEGWLDTFFRKMREQRLRTLQQPRDFQGTLRPYQRYGFSWLSFMRKAGLGACLADDMGLGKTIQVLALLLRERKQRLRKSRPNLLACPTSVVGNWQQEIKRFTPVLETLVHHGTQRRKGSEFIDAAQKVDLVITSYGLLQRDVSLLSQPYWRGVILDEAQNIKNASSKTAQAARKLQAEYRMALTGTPIENRLNELWSLMQFLNPGFLGSERAFREQFLRPIENYQDEQATKQLRSLVNPFILRRMKTDPKIIQDLPEKIEVKDRCGLTREQVTLYEAVVQQMLEDVDRAEGIDRRGQILAGLMKLKQLCNHPALLLHDASQLPGRSGKLQRLHEILEEVIAEGNRALLFTQFKEMGDLLQRYLEENLYCKTLFLHGGVPQKRRQQMVSFFQEAEDAPSIFIISIRAGGTGLNLTRANHVFHFDRWWNPAVEDQATDRAFRIGQKQNVQVHKFVTSGTLEEQIDELIERKKALSESILGGGEDWITELSTEELRRLVELRPDEALMDGA